MKCALDLSPKARRKFATLAMRELGRQQGRECSYEQELAILQDLRLAHKVPAIGPEGGMMRQCNLMFGWSV